VAAGAIACKILKELGITVCAYTRAIGPIVIDDENFDRETILKTTTAMPDSEADQKALEYLNNVRSDSDSAGGIMECIVDGLPTGIGEPVFDKLDANLAKAIMSIGAVKAVEIGDGIAVSGRLGSENNDAFCKSENQIKKLTNHAGGILGGISDGSPVIIRAHVKPTPSIFREQKTVNQSGEEITVQIKGRHDPIIVPRAVVVMECMTALTILDAMMVNMSSKLTSLTDFYRQ
jgi:chorismate synthase